MTEGDFTHAVQEWKRLAPLLKKAGVYSEADRTALLAYCIAYDEWWRAVSEIKRVGPVMKVKIGTDGRGQPLTSIQRNPFFGIAIKSFDQMHKLMGDFGLTPATRARINANAQSDASDPLGALIRSAKNR